MEAENGFGNQGCALRWAKGRPVGANASRHVRDVRPRKSVASAVGPSAGRRNGWWPGPIGYAG